MRNEEVDTQRTSSLGELNVTAHLSSVCGQAARSGETIGLLFQCLSLHVLA